MQTYRFRPLPEEFEVFYLRTSRVGLFNGRTAEQANPPYGEKGHFRKITITLPPDAYEKLIHESARRKIAGEPNHLLSALLREAVDHYMPLLADTAE